LEQIIKEHNIFLVLHGACLIYKTNGSAVSFHASMWCEDKQGSAVYKFGVACFVK